MDEATRLKPIKEYYFSRKLREIRALQSKGKKIINLGIGSPDLPPHPSVIESLLFHTQHGNHQYQSYWGLPELREGIRHFYQKHYAVSLTQDQVVPLMGSKEGIMHISMAFINPGDTVLVPNPGYPTYTSVSKLVEANIQYYTLRASNQWLPDIEQLDRLLVHKPKLMWLNYVHMPTGAIARDEDFLAIVNWARKNNIILVNDNPYSFILTDKARTILNQTQKNDKVLELNSLSKTFNLAGWRVGMLVGNSDLITSVMKVKSNMDSGMYYGIQKAAITALALDDKWFDDLNTKYKKRRKIVYALCDALELTYSEDQAGMFVFTKMPTHLNDDRVFSDHILSEYDLFLTPASIFGDAGRDHIRISLCASENVLEEALNRVNA